MGDQETISLLLGFDMIKVHINLLYLHHLYAVEVYLKLSSSSLEPTLANFHLQNATVRSIENLRNSAPLTEADPQHLLEEEQRHAANWLGDLRLLINSPHVTLHDPEMLGSLQESVEEFIDRTPYVFELLIRRSSHETNITERMLEKLANHGQTAAMILNVASQQSTVLRLTPDIKEELMRLASLPRPSGSDLR